MSQEVTEFYSSQLKYSRIAEWEVPCHTPISKH